MTAEPQSSAEPEEDETKEELLHESAVGSAPAAEEGGGSEGNLGEKLTRKLIDGVDEETFLKLIDRVGLLPTDQPVESHQNEHHHHQHASSSQSQTHADTPTAAAAPQAIPTPGKRITWSEPPSPSLDEAAQRAASSSLSSSSETNSGVAPSIGPSRRERAFAKISALKTAATSAASSPAREDPPAVSPITPGRQLRPLRGASTWQGRSLTELQQLQRNLESRLRAFWTFRVEHREVRIEIEAIFSDAAKQAMAKAEKEMAESGKALNGGDKQQQPRLLATTALWTNSTGRFEHRLTIPWYMLDAFCKHHQETRNVHPREIVALRIRAVLMEHKNPLQKVYEWATGEAAGAAAATTGGEAQKGGGAQAPDHFRNHVDTEATPWIEHRVTTEGPGCVRVISDIDDTVKQTDVVGGLRAVFHNAFVKSFEEVQIEGVAAWYRAMEEARAPIHYVSNAPLELYGLARGFLQTARMPLGHLHLKLYPSGTRNLLASWLEPAGERKRGAVTKILDAFPQSNFLLIGDSGELDLELYAALAAERPDQIRAIFIRDVSTPIQSLLQFRRNNTIGVGQMNAASNSIAPPPQAHLASNPPSETPAVNTRPPPMLRRLTGDSTASVSGAANISSGAASTPGVGGGGPGYLTEAEWRRREAFRARVQKAREMVPRSTLLKFYRTGGECEQTALRLIRELQAGLRTVDR